VILYIYNIYYTPQKYNNFLHFFFIADELVEPKLCEMFNPPFGCCWDNRTVALGPNGEGCPSK